MISAHSKLWSEGRILAAKREIQRKLTLAPLKITNSLGNS